MTIKNHSVVSFHYTLTDTDGAQLDSSEGKDPLTYLHGASNIISGLEKELEGKSIGDKLNVTVAPEEAYGVSHEGMIQEVPREAFGENQEIEVGMRFEAQTDQGPVSVVVTTVTDSHVTVDGNHPLAGKTLIFDVEIMDIRDASPEEMDHGHAHGPGGHQH